MYDFIEIATNYKYISWVYSDQEPESYLQFIRKQPFNGFATDVVYGFEFEEFYYSRLFTIRPFSHATIFLDYHFEKYAGNKFDFLIFVKWSLSIMEILKLDFLEKINELSQTPIIKDLILEWIEKKKNELNTDETPTPKRTTPKLNEYNKPVLTQKQTAILFKLFKDRNLFVIHGLKQNRYEEIISQLTGYSKNTLHQDFSAKDFLSISDKPEDYQKIIAELQGVITVLSENIVK